MNIADYKRIFTRMSVYVVFWDNVPNVKPEIASAPTDVKKLTYFDIYSQINHFVANGGIYYVDEEDEVVVSVVTDNKNDAVNIATELFMNRHYD